MVLTLKTSRVIQEMNMCQNHKSYLSFGDELDLQVNGPVDKIGRISLPPLEDVCQQPEFPADVRRRRERREGPATLNIMPVREKLAVIFINSVGMFCYVCAKVWRT